MSARRGERVSLMRKPPSYVVIGTLYVLAMAGVACWSAWPIYRTEAFLLLAGVATAAGLLLAAASRLWSWPAWLTATATAGAFLMLGLPLAVPSALAGIERVPAGFVQLLLGAVTGWKDLITVQLPIGSYRNLLVPALVVFLLGTLLTARAAWHPNRSAIASSATVGVALAMVTFGLVFGASAASAPLQLGALTLVAPTETALGLLALVLSLGFLAWRASAERSRALRRAANSSGVRMSRRRTASDTRRVLLAGAMVIAGVAAAAFVAPAMAQSLPREVLRTGVGPELQLRAAPSPLGEYRSYFVDGAFDSALFTVSSSGPLPERLRLATLDAYDGEVFRAFDPAAGVEDARFIRVPARMTPALGEDATVRVEIDNYQGIWMPMAGSLATVQFEGPRSAALADAFYYRASGSSAVQTADGGLSEGDSYQIDVAVPAPRDVASLLPPAAAGASRIDPPESLKQWIEDQNVGTGGAALVELVDRLRARGYLSHALALPDTENRPSWVSALGDYAFQPSASGHSLARIDALFRQLLARQAEANAETARGADTSLVAAIGDDEQFAAATVLIAEQLGFPARVVLGVRLTAAEGDSACIEGVCRGGDVSAWVEVQADDGAWVPIDVTPQHAVGVQQDAQQQRDPENVTEVRPDTAKEVVPPAPAQQDAVRPDDENEQVPLDLSALWSALRVTALVVLIAALVLGPFVVIVGAKVLRRRARRREGDAAAQIVGGWDEYVDAALDRGRTAPAQLTRTELAAHFGSEEGGALAVMADRAVFANEPTQDDDSATFWRIVDAERAMLSQGDGMWQRMRAAISLRSFARYLSPSKAARARAAAWLPERRKRTRSTGPRRS